MNVKSQWEKSGNGISQTTYYLTRESNPEWMAKVYSKNGMYTFVIGKRAKEGEPTPERFEWENKGFKNYNDAKQKALVWIKEKQNEK